MGTRPSDLSVLARPGMEDTKRRPNTAYNAHGTPRVFAPTQTIPTFPAIQKQSSRCTRVPARKQEALNGGHACTSDKDHGPAAGAERGDAGRP